MFEEKGKKNNENLKKNNENLKNKISKEYKIISKNVSFDWEKSFISI